MPSFLDCASSQAANHLTNQHMPTARLSGKPSSESYSHVQEMSAVVCKTEMPNGDVIFSFCGEVGCSFMSSSSNRHRVTD